MTLRRRCALIQRQWYDVGLILATWKTSLVRSLWPASFAVLANAPARYAMATRDSQFGFGFVASLALGVLAGLACLSPVFALVLIPAEWLAARRPGDRSAARTALVTATATVALITAVMWVVSVGATEFRIQRGTYPSLAETIGGLSDPEFIRGSAKVTLFERYSWPTLGAFFAWTGLLVAYGWSRRRPRGPIDSARRAALGGCSTRAAA